MALVALLSVTSLTQTFLPAEDIECIEDKLINWSHSLNNYFASHILIRKVLMRIGGLLIDGMVLTMLVRFALYGKSWRIIIAFVMLYLAKLICSVSSIILSMDYSHCFN